MPPGSLREASSHSKHKMLRRVYLQREETERQTNKQREKDRQRISGKSNIPSLLTFEPPDFDSEEKERKIQL